jgi:transcriptional regulator of acetoin/glycerol metabolism
MLTEYNWPGNVRELQHCIERLAALHTDGVLEVSDFAVALPEPHGQRQSRAAVAGCSRRLEESGRYIGRRGVQARATAETANGKPSPPPSMRPTDSGSAPPSSSG